MTTPLNIVTAKVGQKVVPLNGMCKGQTGTIQSIDFGVPASAVVQMDDSKGFGSLTVAKALFDLKAAK